MNQYPETSVRIEGYTDNVGSAEGYLNLSKGRAESVASVITSMGIDASRITSEGFGDANPVASNDSAEGRGQNRRVVAVVLQGE